MITNYLNLPRLSWALRGSSAVWREITFFLILRMNDVLSLFQFCILCFDFRFFPSSESALLWMWMISTIKALSADIKERNIEEVGTLIYEAINTKVSSK